MSLSPEIVESTRELLDPLGGISMRAMMGGRSIYRHGVIFAVLARDGTLYLKAEGEMADRLRALGGEDFAWTRKDGSVASMCYVSVPGDMLDEPERLREVALEAFGALG